MFLCKTCDIIYTLTFNKKGDIYENNVYKNEQKANMIPINPPEDS